MYHHVKKLMFTVRVDEPDPRFGNMLLEQFGGANGDWRPPCSIRSRASTARMPIARIY
jgi:manganese catalase